METNPSIYERLSGVQHVQELQEGTSRMMTTLTLYTLDQRMTLYKLDVNFSNQTELKIIFQGVAVIRCNPLQSVANARTTRMCSTKEWRDRFNSFAKSGKPNLEW
ncbi:hypothetical protein RRG08_029513 [Elysia crispata]|uniref:Uncharacterized protein n=1 Tax=Elysia crispata TaxID=231223 RepID=A0AAE0XX69_9GAST|nr:hypothetical protein RRG08_029513 [Elysia crispata]